MPSDNPSPSSRESFPYQQSPPSIPAFSEVSDLLRPGYFALETSLNASSMLDTLGQTSGVHTPPARLDMLRVRSAPVLPHIGRQSSAQLSLRDSASSRFLPPSRAPRSEPVVADETSHANTGSHSPPTPGARFILYLNLHY